MARARLLAALALPLALNLFTPAATAASTPTGPVVLALLDLHGSTLTVTETVASPGQGSFSVWQGATSTTVTAGLASIVGPHFTVPPGTGAQSAQVSYVHPFTGRGITVRWPFPTEVDTLWVLVGTGLRLPVILNQKFYPAPSTVWAGKAYSVYRARSVRGMLILNLQQALPQMSLQQRVLPYLWLVPVAFLAWLILRRLSRGANA